MFQTFLSDLSYAFRSFRNQPALTSIAVLSLAIGLGATVGAASLLDALGFRPPAVHDPASLVQIQTSQADGPFGAVSYADYEDIRDQMGRVVNLAAYGVKGAGVSSPDAPPEIVLMNVVSPEYFAALGVGAAIGRTLQAADGPGAPPAIVISERLGRRRFESMDRAVAGVLTLNGTVCTVAGVMPAAFAGLTPHLSPDVWILYSTWEGLMSRGRLGPSRRDDRWFTLVGRLIEAPTARDRIVIAAGRSPAGVRGVQRELDGIVAGLRTAHPDTNPSQRAQVLTLTAARSGRLFVLAALLWLIVGVVLLTGCANVAGLLVGRAEQRRREMAIRVAIGATRRRLVAQLLTESLALAALASGAGLVIGFWVIRSLPALLPTFAVPLGLSFRLDLRVLAVALLASAATVLVFGLWPALVSARAGIAQASSSTADMRLGGWSARSLLVVAQIAVSFVLVVSGVLLTRGLHRAGRVDTGFAIRPMLLATIAPAVIGYDDAHTRAFFRDLVDRLRATSGVRNVGLARRIPLDPDGGGAAREIVPPDRSPSTGRPLTIPYNSVSPTYFEMMGTRLVSGRGFSDLDRPGGASVVIVNETMARRYWPDGEAVGQHLRVRGPGAGDFEIVGVAQDGKYNSLGEEPRPYLFFSLLQVPAGELTLMVQSEGDTSSAAGFIRAALAGIDPRMPTLQMMTLEAHTRLALYEPRLMVILVGSVAAAGLLLSVIGLYGVVAFVVARRTREIAVRMALGARPVDVLVAVMRRAVALALTGVVAGAAIALLVTRLLARSIYGVSPSEPRSFVMTAALMIVVSAVASWRPARRAMRVDPAAAFRVE